MNPEFYAINVGRGDAFVLEIPCGERTSIVLIDGGDYSKHDALLTFFHERRIVRIDLLILTHLHADHLGGLLPVAESLEIVEAVLPYPEFKVNGDKVSHPVAIETQQVLKNYEHLFRLLKGQGTALAFRPPFGAQKSWEFGQTRLRHLYPETDEDLSGYDLIQQLGQNIQSDQQEQLYIEFDRLSNRDSSIWLVEDTLTQAGGLALGGDAVLSSWKRLLARVRLFPHALKISHHGMEDALDEWLLQELTPEWILITTNFQEYMKYHDRWETLSRLGKCRLFLLGQDQEIQGLNFSLPGESLDKNRERG